MVCEILFAFGFIKMLDQKGMLNLLKQVLHQPIVNIEGNGYETRQSSLLYVFVLIFALDSAQNTIVIYSIPRN